MARTFVSNCIRSHVSCRLFLVVFSPWFLAPSPAPAVSMNKRDLCDT